MTDIETLKVKDTALVNEICDLGDITIDKNRRWSIEFDDYGIQGVVDAIRKNFVEQACEVVDSVTTNSKAPGFNNGYDHCKEKVKRAIRNKFKC